VVLRRRDTKAHAGPPAELRHRERVTVARPRAVRDDQIDFVIRVHGSHIAPGRQAAGGQADDHDPVAVHRVLALDAKQAAGDVEQQVVAQPFAQRPTHADAEFDRRGRDARFGDVSLLRGRQIHPPKVRAVA
jgi:hypothetical protein